MKASGSISIPYHVNFFEYRPLIPLNVGMPLGADTPAPVIIKISLYFIIALTTSLVDFSQGKCSYCLP